MAMEQPATLSVVSAGEVVEAEWTPSGVPGLALVGQPVTTQCRLVHMASGRAVSRSAEHPDPDAVRDLARRIGPLADWTDRNVAVSVPRLRQALDQAITAWQAAYPVPGQQRSWEAAPTAQKSALETLADRFREVEQERLLLRRIVRRLYDAMAPGAFADALAGMSQADREFVRSLVHDDETRDATGVVQAIRRPGDLPGPRPAATSTRPPVGGRTGRFGGPDAAAS
jgi:hypothetical protein